MRTEVKKFLFIGSCNTESATSKLKTAGIQYNVKYLESMPANWIKILRILKHGNISGVLVKLTSVSYRLICKQQYSSIAKQLFDALSNVPHIVFVYRDLFDSNTINQTMNADTDYEKSLFQHTPEGDEFIINARIHTALQEEEEQYENSPFKMKHARYFSIPNQCILSKVNSMLSERNINVITYKTNAELSVVATTFIDRTDKNMIFRVYIPNGMMWAHETEKYLQLFGEYLIKACGIKIRQEQYKTSCGIVYEFYCDQQDATERIQFEYNEFSNFMRLCANNVPAATSFLERKNLDNKMLQDIIDRYSKEARRLHIDLKHTRENALLSIRHRLEAELSDAYDCALDNTLINEIIDTVIPQVQDAFNTLIPGIATYDSLQTLKDSHKIGNADVAKTIIIREVHGNVNLGSSAQEILSLLHSSGNSNIQELTSAVHELEDNEIKLEDKLIAKNKVLNFLKKAGGKLSDAAMALLTSYVESKIGI